MKADEAIKILNPQSGNIEHLTAAFTDNKNMDGAEEAFNMLWELGEANVNRRLIKENNSTNVDELKREQTAKDKAIQEHIESIIDKIKDLDGIKAEVCGSWLWVEGNTKEHANSLKDAGLKWARKKKKWYWRPAGQKRKRSGKPWEMEKIREKYGSQDIKAA